MGNWEILTKMHELIPNENPVGGMYRPLKNPLIDEHVKKQRESGGSQLFSRKRGLIMAQKFLKKGGFLGILCDQWAGGAGTMTKLFGKESSITPLPAILHSSTSALSYPYPYRPSHLDTGKCASMRPFISPLISIRSALQRNLSKPWKR